MENNAPPKSVSLEQLCEDLSGLSSALICTHVAPDPDAIGSSFALQRCLAARGVSAQVYLGEELPRRMSEFARGVPHILEVPEQSFDAVIITDTAVKNRMGPEYELLCSRASTVINIDHHASNPGWGTINYIDSESPSTASIILDIAQFMEIPVDSQTAELLFAGLLDDTGSFRFSNANAGAFKSAEALVSYGARPDVVAQALYFSVPRSQLALQTRALQTLEVLEAGRLACLWVSDEMLAECGSTAEETEGLVDLARCIDGVIVAVFIRQIKDGWKASLRSSHSSVDVNQIAGSFGGGGHTMAAGCRLDGTLESGKDALFQEIKQALQKASI